MADRPRPRLLDIPAGEGALAARLVADGFRVTAVDLYPEMFRLEKVEIRSANLDARLPFDDASFEAIVARGTLVVSVPNIMNIEERLKWLLGGYTSHFKPLSQAARRRIAAESDCRDEVVLHVNPIGYAAVRFLLEKNGFELEAVHRDKPNANAWAFWPIAAVIRLVSQLSSKQKRDERWADEQNSDEVLLGGNTLIFEAPKL